jgi:hypothetical protein
MYMAFFYIYVVFAAIALIGLHFPSEEAQAEVKQYAEELKKQKDESLGKGLLEKDEPFHEECPNVLTGVCYYKFWIMFLMNSLGVSYGVFMAAAFKSFGAIRIDDDVFLSVVGALTGIFNGVFRIIWGQWMDYTSFNFVYRIIMVI